ncbi:MAG: hypothetical protein AVO35_09915 [Candidatus Aegiribacteria sp. MLS_C]|nr:MAG: hypothetical protein AVO35_09915 [Candidatus Aegiribacteria sp. MLS_C]
MILFALILSSILGWGLGWRHPAGTRTAAASVLFLFVVLLIAMWAAASWMPEWGPVYQGTPWLGVLLAGLFVTLVIMAVSAPDWRRYRRRTELEAETAAETMAVFGCFFWILIIAFVAMVIAGL